MGHATFPDLGLGGDPAHPPVHIRIGGRHLTVVGALLDGGQATFDNGVLTGKSRAEVGIAFGPEVLRAMNGRRVVALFMAAGADEQGRPGWIGVTVGEMRVDAAKKDGYRDVNAFQTKLTDAAKGRTTVWQLKEAEKATFVRLLAAKPDLWIHAARPLRETVLASIPEAASVGAAPGDPKPGEGPEAPDVFVGTGAGYAPVLLRAQGRDVTVVGILLQGGQAEWDNAVLSGRSHVEQGISFGGESLRAPSGRRVCALFVSIATAEDGRPGWFGATVAEMRIDPAKKEGFRDMAASGMKMNDAARGRVDLWRLKPEEKAAVKVLLQAEGPLWEAAFENVREALA
jgi:hypothetical protein